MITHLLLRGRPCIKPKQQTFEIVPQHFVQAGDNFMNDQPFVVDWNSKEMKWERGEPMTWNLSYKGEKVGALVLERSPNTHERSQGVERCMLLKLDRACHTADEWIKFRNFVLLPPKGA